MSSTYLLDTMPWHTGETLILDERLNHFAIIEPLMMPKIKEWAYRDQMLHTVDIQPLFKNTLFNASAEQGPYLMNLQPEGVLIDQLKEALITSSAGCLISSKAGFNDVYAQCQKKLLVSSGEDANQALLRFYDPRNLAMFLGALTDSERALWMGHLEEIQWFHHKWYQLKQTPLDEVIDYHLNMTKTLKETMHAIQKALQESRIQG